MRRSSLKRAGLLTVALALAACSDNRPTEAASETPAPSPVATPATPAVPEPAPLPPELEALAKTLEAVQAFNAATPESLVGVGRAEQQIRRAASRAMEMSVRAGAATEEERRRLSGQVAAARAEADRARSSLTTAFSAFQATSAEQTAQVEAALEQCSTIEGLAASEPCVALAAEQPLLAQNVAALAERYQAADNAWRIERAKLEEASATMALAL